MLPSMVRKSGRAAGRGVGEIWTAEPDDEWNMSAIEPIV